MTAFQQYSKVEVYLNGTLMTESASVKIDRKSNAQMVYTMAKGLAGPSPGAPIQNVSIETAVPAVGFEFDFGDAIKNGTELEFTFFAADKTMTVKGFCTDDGLSAGVNAETKLAVTVITELGTWI